MSAFENFARPYFQTENRLGFRVSVVRPNGSTTMYVVRYSFTTKFIRTVMKDIPDSQVNVFEMVRYDFPLNDYFVEVLPF